MIVSRFGSCYVIVPADTSAKKLILPMYLHIDKAFFEWMKDIPRLHS
jgi:hypothetical protein